MTKEALKLALKALETNNKAWKHLADSGDAGFWEAEEQPFYELSVKAITAIKEALANEALEKKAENARELGLDYEPEPVAWITEWEGQYSSGKILDYIAHTRGEKVEYTPLYTTPPQRTWVGLTDEEIDGMVEVTDLSGAYYYDDLFALARAIEAKLRSKNGY